MKFIYLLSNYLNRKIGRQKYWLHALLFLLTFITTTIAGASWSGHPIIYSIDSILFNFNYGLPFSLSFLTMLTLHEFGHFFMSVKHRIQCSLPYYLPVPPIPFLLNIGTFGAFIRIRQKILNSICLFDVGVSGPIAGFFVSVVLLSIGFFSLDTYAYLYEIHPEYEGLEVIPQMPNTIAVGKNLLYIFFEAMFDNPYSPPMTEMYHYPFLFSGWLGCFVTALNLLPIGQLDGGHVIYAMFGRNVQKVVGTVCVYVLFFLGAPSFLQTVLSFIFFMFDSGNAPVLPEWITFFSWEAWIIWGIIMIFFIKIPHPPVLEELPLDKRRTKIGLASILMFIVCFTPVPFYYT